MPRKRIVFVIVEGPSDEEALGTILNRYFDRNAVHVYVAHCDITSELSTTPSNVVAEIGGFIKNFAGRVFKSGDFSRIIHIVDMDGAFIPDDAIVEDSTITKPVYSPTKIRAQRKASIENRNRRKRENLNRLVSTTSVWRIPYQIYYMSCNLDHALYGKLNSTDEEKERDSYAFAIKYKEDIPGFIKLVNESNFSVMSGYSQSWQYIREGLHSLERHSNFGLCLKAKNDTEDILKTEPGQ